MNYWTKLFTKPGKSEITSNETSLIVSILSVGTFFGALLSGLLADFIGRRWAIILSCMFPFNLGVILQTASTSQPLFIAGRFFAGMGVGLVSGQVPLYQSETMPKWVRGAVVGSYQLSINIGLFLAACIEYGTSEMWNTGSYRIPVAIQFAWALILSAGMLFFPESPRWLVKKHRHDDAVHSLTRLRRLPPDHPALEEELNEVLANYEKEMAAGKATLATFFELSIFRRLATGCLIQALQQLSGINFVFYYGTKYFKRTGFQSNPFILQMVITAVSIVSIFPGLLAVDRLGRRPILLTGSIGMTVSLLIVATLGTTVTDPEINGDPSKPIQKLIISFICFYVFFFEMSWGPCPWAVTGEMFPLNIRARCLSMTTASNWLFNFVVTFITPYMTDADKGNLNSKVFYLWMGFCAVSIVFVWFMIYETRNLTLEEVDELFRTVHKAWKSKYFRPTVRAETAIEKAKDDGGEKGSKDLDASLHTEHVD